MEIYRILKQIIIGILVAASIAFFANLRVLNDKVIALENKLEHSTKFEKTVVDDITNLKNSRENLSEYYVTRREFNAIVKDLKEYNVELKGDLNKRFDKMEDLILRNK